MEKELKKLAMLFGGIVICFFIIIFANNSTDDNFNVVNEQTGVALREKISCLPKDELTIKLYKENGIALYGLPDCEDYAISGPVTSKEGVIPDSGFFNKFLVRPLAFLFIKVANLFDNYLIAFVVLILIKSIFMIRNNYKMAVNNKKMSLIKEKLNEIGKRYNKDSDYWNEERPYNESLAKIAYADDLRALYAENKIHPMAGCLTSIIQIPILIAFLTVIYTIPSILETQVFGLSLGASPKVLFTIHPIVTFIVIALLVLSTFFNTVTSTDKIININKSSIISSLITVGLLLVITFSLPLGVIIYFIISDIFNIFGKIVIYKILSK